MAVRIRADRHSSMSIPLSPPSNTIAISLKERQHGPKKYLKTKKVERYLRSTILFAIWLLTFECLNNRFGLHLAYTIAPAIHCFIVFAKTAWQNGRPRGKWRAR